MTQNTCDVSGLGTAVIQPHNPVVAAHVGTWTITYTVGSKGIKAGGAVRIHWRHCCDWGSFQVDDPAAPDYVSVSTSDQAKLEVNRKEDWDLLPWQQFLEITVKDDQVVEGDPIAVVLGDTSGGSPGTRAQSFIEKTCEFRITVDPNGDGVFKMIKHSPSLEIIGGLPLKGKIFAPSFVTVNKPFKVTVKLEDEHGNPGSIYKGSVTLYSSENDTAVSDVHTLEKGEQCAFAFDNCCFKNAGIKRLKVKDADKLNGTSNPVVCLDRPPQYGLYWGDIHGHTELGDGTGSVDDYYRYARDVAGLDFCAATEEDYLFTDASWVEFIETAKQYHEPGRFVTFLGYEWSGQAGDHNVYYRDEAGPLYRNNLRWVGMTEFIENRNVGEEHPLCRDNAIVPEIQDLYERLKGTQAMIIPHVGGGRANFKWHSPELEPVLEMYSNHGSFEWFAREALGTQSMSNGFQMGLIAGSDCHTGRPGDSHRGFLGWTRCHGGLTGIYAPELTREALWEAIFQHRVYATSGERIILEFSVNNRFMGDKIHLENNCHPRIIHIHAVGTDIIKRIDIIKNNLPIYTYSGDKDEATVEYIDKEEACEGDFYYVRVIQKDHETAWSSPVWIG